MADIREVFTIVENDSTGAGEKLPSRTDGGQAATGNHMGVLAFKNSSGDDVKPQLTASGAISVDTGTPGTPQSASAGVTIAALNTEQDVVSEAVAVNEVVVTSMAMGSSFQPVLWILYHNDNATLNELARFVTGPGDFNHSAELLNIGFTAGAAGTQELVLRATQLRGPLSDAHGTISLLNQG